MSSLPPDHALGELLAFVRAHSPFYKDFYAAGPPGSTRLTDYPVLDSQRFWAANTVQDNQVFTAPLTEGITFKSGGTTGQPKYSVFTHAEWRSFTDAFGQGMRRAGLQPGDRIGNLFYAGKLYASFLFIARSIEAAGVGICYPIAGDDLDENLATWRQFDLNVLAGVPTTLMKLLERLTPEDRARLRLQTFLYGGEPMFDDQIAAVQAVFPGCQGGALQHVIAGKAVTAEEASTEEFREYIHAVVRNCRAMCDEFISMGYKVVTGGTDNHLFLLDLTDTGLTGKAVQDELDRHGITLNKNCVPNETRSPQQTSGVRIGTAAMTTKGYTEQDFIAVARQIDRIIRDMQDMRKE